MNQAIHSTRQTLRAAMPITRKWAYFDHAAVAPITQPAADAIATWLTQITEEGDTVWLDWVRHVANARTSAASLIGAKSDDISLLPNTTAGINLVAEGLDWHSGDNVVTLEDEFPSNLYPWMQLKHRGVETRLVPTNQGRVDPTTIAEYCDERTRVVSISWVCYSNGCRRALRPIADVAHERGAIFFVDAIQGLGVFPLDVTEDGIDALAADGHKWLMGPEGAGIAYVNQKCLEQLKPIGVGWKSVVQEGNFNLIELDLKQTAARYEGGTLNKAGFIGLGASLDLFLSLGIENIAAAILDITDQACEKLTAAGAVVCSPREGENRSGIVSFELPKHDSEKFKTFCYTQSVALNCRAGRLRLSAHAYNTEEDLDRLLTAIELFKSR